MGVYFMDSLCRKCPHFSKNPCRYKINFYKNVKLKNPRYKLLHKCQQYSRLFEVGQTVVIDLYDRVRNENGEIEEILAHRNVPGIVRGVNGCKFQVELLEPHVVRFRKGGRKKPEKGNVIFKCSKNAKDIRPLIFCKKSIMADRQGYILWRKKHKGAKRG